MYVIPPEFKDFISLKCKRLEFIQNYLNSYGIEAPVMPIDGKNHIYVKFPIEQYNPSYKIKTVIAHYDRAEGTYGANDNSAAVFCMLEWARKLIQYKTPHNIRIIFTDGEEENEKGVTAQGAFSLAKLFVKLHLQNDDVFIFDCMGRGNIPIICEQDFSEKVSQSYINRFNDLENRMMKILIKANNGKWFKLKTAYSDNAGFIANGIPCCTITMLPSNEISDLIRPKTWDIIHTTFDNLDSLSPESFQITQKIFDLLADARFYS